MARNSDERGQTPGVRRQIAVGARLYQKWDAKQVVRIVLGVLLVANLAAMAMVLFPPGGSAEDLTRQLASLETQATAQKATLERSQQHASAVERGRVEGDQFLGEYFLESRTAFSTLLSELDAAASQSKIVQRETAYSQDPIEGSDSLSMMSITAAYVGKYADLMRFVHELDRSPRLLIIESMTAAPQTGSDDLNVSMKLDTFVRDNPSRTHGDGAAGQ